MAIEQGIARTGSDDALVGRSVFDQACCVFDGWTDIETGARVLRLDVRGDREVSAVWQTLYQQAQCFLRGGRQVVLRTCRDNDWPGLRTDAACLLDLTTGEITHPFPPEYMVVEVCDTTQNALLLRRDDERQVILWDLYSEQTLASIDVPEGWSFSGMCALADGQRALVGHIQGRPHNEPVHSRVYLLIPGEPARLLFEAQNFTCNHFQGCPTDPNVFAYDRWPAPRRDVAQVMHIASLDGSFHEPAKLDAYAVRPVSMLGVRDHYVWTPDGQRIVSYLNPDPDLGPTPQMGNEKSFGTDFNHFTFPWVLSALDWRTGEDLSAPYPAGRWGCHMTVTPDGRYIVSAGGPGYDYLYAIELDGLRHGWNEQRICSYPRTVSQGRNHEPFAFPFVLPDGSGVLFNAGWPGPDHGIYLAQTEW